MPLPDSDESISPTNSQCSSAGSISSRSSYRPSVDQDDVPKKLEGAERLGELGYEPLEQRACSSRRPQCIANPAAELGLEHLKPPWAAYEPWRGSLMEHSALERRGHIGNQRNTGRPRQDTNGEAEPGAGTPPLGSRNTCQHVRTPHYSTENETSFLELASHDKEGKMGLENIAQEVFSIVEDAILDSIAPLRQSVNRMDGQLAALGGQANAARGQIDALNGILESQAHAAADTMSSLDKHLHAMKGTLEGQAGILNAQISFMATILDKQVGSLNSILETLASVLADQARSRAHSELDDAARKPRQDPEDVDLRVRQLGKKGMPQADPSRASGASPKAFPHAAPEEGRTAAEALSRPRFWSR